MNLSRLLTEHSRFGVSPLLMTGLSCCLGLMITNFANAQQSHSKVTRSFTEPIEQSDVASSETGVIVEVLAEEGDRVQAGQPLAMLDHEVMAQAKKIAEARAKSTAAWDSASAQEQMLQAQKQSVDQLVNGGHANMFEVQQKHAEYASAAAELKRTEDEMHLNALEVERLDAELKRRTINSPIDGFVTNIHKRLGEHLSNTEPQYATVVRIDRLKVRFYLDEDALDALTPNSEVQILVGRKQEPMMAKIKFVSPVIDPDSGTGRVEVILDNRALKIRSGTVCFWSNDHNTDHDVEVDVANTPKTNPVRR